MNIRIGYGWDSHAFKPGVPLKIGGLAIEHPEGLAGHSDGDVLLHAITDALLGAVSPGDPRWKNADSSIFLNLALEEIENAGYRIVNVDTTLVLAAPKIGPLAGELRERVAELLNLKPADVGIKAKTPEGLNADHVAQAHVVVLLEKIEDQQTLRSMSAVIENQKQLEDVVKDLVSQVHGVEPLTEIKPLFDTDDIT
jgi:2-C-methyl-D-erythritol 2,4-cyclodiphosphate synthase